MKKSDVLELAIKIFVEQTKNFKPNCATIEGIQDYAKQSINCSIEFYRECEKQKIIQD